MLLISTEAEVKRAKNVIFWSRLYLLGTWISLFATTLNRDHSKLHASDALLLFTTPISVIAGMYIWQWTKSLIITSHSIQPEGFGYRQGWAFWGWITPVFSWWVPKRLIDNTYLIFSQYSERALTLSTKKWWALYVSATIFNNVGLRSGSLNTGLSIAASAIAAICLTFAYNPWICVVQETSLAHQAAIEKLSHR